MRKMRFIGLLTLVALLPVSMVLAQGPDPIPSSCPTAKATPPPNPEEAGPAGPHTVSFPAKRENGQPYKCPKLGSCTVTREMWPINQNYLAGYCAGKGCGGVSIPGSYEIKCFGEKASDPPAEITVKVTCTDCKSPTTQTVPTTAPASLQF
jgi:hypothetical protein